LNKFQGNFLDSIDQITNQDVAKMNADFQAKPTVQKMQALISAGKGNDLADPRMQGKITCS
jgi:hypothetical protein